MESAAAITTATPVSVEGFTYEDLSLRVVAPQPMLVWLAEFLAPAFVIGAGDDYDATVVLQEDPAAYEAAVAHHAGAETSELDCFINDSHVIRLPALTTSSGTIAFQASHRVVYRVDAPARAVTLLSRPGNPSARTALMRVVRELAMNRSLRRGGVFLHAAACAGAGRGMLLAGEKHAGKTTLLLYLLRATGTPFISNDRVLLPSPNADHVRAMPTIVTLRADTLAFFPRVRSELVTKSFSHQRTLAEAAADTQPARPWRDGSFGISPAQLTTLLGVEREAACMSRVILFPQRTNEANAGGLRELTPSEASIRIRSALLSAGLAKKTSDLFTFRDDPPPPEAEHLAQVAAAFSTRLRCLECQLGAYSYNSGALAEQCLRLLTG